VRHLLTPKPFIFIMLWKHAVLATLTTAADLEDEVTLLQVHNKVSSLELPVAKAMSAVAHARSPQEASVLMQDLASRAVRGEVKIDDATKDALTNMVATLEESEGLLETASQEEQTLRDDAAAAVAACKTTYDAGRQEDAMMGNEVGDTDDSHHVCRSALDDLHNDMTTKCTALNQFITGLVPPSCAKPDRYGMEGYFQGLKNHYDSNYDQWKARNEACVAAEQARTNKDGECDTIQGQFETKFCAYRLEMYTTCSEYVGCYENMKNSFDEVMSTTSKGQESRELEWTAIQKIKCYIGVLTSDKENDDRKAELEACQALDPTLDHLGLSEPDVADREACNLAPVANYPCTDGFIADRYSGMQDLLECTACPALPAHIDVENGHICAAVEDTPDGWSNTKHAAKDGVTYMGGFDHGQKKVTKVFQLVPGVQYKWSVIMDTWGSVDNEAMKLTANDKVVNIQTRGAGDCNNGWTPYAYGTGTFLGSGGSGRHNWQDCWKKIEQTITAPANGKVAVEMFMNIDQHINDEAWGWHAMKFDPVNCPAVSKANVKDDCAGWSVDKTAEKDGICYMGAYDNSQKTVTKTFENLTPGCTYTWKAVIDTWASVDNEQMIFTINGKDHSFQSRGCCSCTNGWTEYPHDFGDFVGSHGSANGGWKDCYKNFETDVVIPSSGKAEVKMFMNIDQHINDEGWGWHSMEFDRKSCPSAADIADDCEGWSVGTHHDIDGKCFMGAFDYNNKRVTKTFTGLSPGKTYKWSAVIDTWASVDNEQMVFTINGQANNFQSRSHNSCNNGWTEYPNDFGDKVGSHGSANGGWKDCYKNFETTFVAPSNGKAEVDMYMAIDQHINDEGWGWHDMKFTRLDAVADDCEGWSVGTHHDIDGKCYMGAFDYNNKKVTKTFSGLKAGCTYKWKAVIDTWASVDNEQMKFTVNGQATNFQSRSHNSCNNGWTEYPNDFGDKVGSHGSANGGWKDCWKNFETEFTPTADGKANVEMYMAIDQHINDEGWGWHDMVFEKLSCR
jgi:uncharacterized protein (DUF2141 family)